MTCSWLLWKSLGCSNLIHRNTMTSPQVKLRPATINDKPYLYDLAQTVYKGLIVNQFGVWDEKVQRNKFDSKWEKASYQIIELNNKRIGTIWVTVAGDHIKLNEIQIRPEHQRQGIGSALVSEQLGIAQKLGIPMRLRLLRGNRAVNFYERLGFVVCDQTENYIYMTTRKD